MAVFRVLHAHLLAAETGTTDAPPLVAQLVDLGLASVAEDALAWATADRMDTLVAQRATEHTRALPDLLTWVAESAAPAVTALQPKASASWHRRLAFRLHEAVCDARTRQLLSLIRAFPASRPALDDLRDCIRATDRKPFVAAALRDQFQAAMLNAGTPTDLILQQYVSMIRTLRFLDPTAVIVDVVTRPILDYLRRRPDTVRCIVTGMTGDGDLYRELERGRARRRCDPDGDVAMSGDPRSPSSSSPLAPSRATEPGDDDCQSVDGDLDGDLSLCAADYDEWKPAAVDAPSRRQLQGSTAATGGDAIATLVTIYGSSEQIVAEYRAALADKLVQAFDVDIVREERILALLTERFGREAMHDCAIMLRDVRSSRETLQRARNTHGDSLAGFDATVISKEFWPRLGDEGEFVAPPSLQRQMNLFGGTFEQDVAPRKLRWQHGLGVVQIRLRFQDGRETVVSVSPMQGAILALFAEKSRLEVAELQRELGVQDEALLRRKIQALANQGVLRAVDGRGEAYETIEDGSEVNGVVDDEQAEGEGADDGEAGASEHAEMAVYESYVMAMLQNLKQLSLEQVHSMLKRFVQTPVYDKTPAQLAAFLAVLVEKGKVEVTAGMYKVKK